ncbi:DMT family transporter [Micromonospora cathayae]|uniref:DMT family transporter n=1 Tax=Micromonospora cathayae TaxID=3028804 RepID=A0ABY7ZNC3_9ACTN|nr:DMT family transporter [Micromonospora sp. HUAS 3]WDZ83394.1 DMT family transporter [Micromonospora sp. HUAS 3]
MVTALLLAVAAAFCFALSAALHQRAARQQQPRRALDPRLLLRLLRSRLWLSGWLPDSAGAVLQATALRFGPLALVQPVLASGLFMAVLVEAVWDRRRVRPRDLTAVTVGTVGLAVFLVVADIRAGVSDPAPSRWWGAGVLAGGVVASCVAVSHRLTGAARGAVLGVASGVAYSVTAALVKTVVGRYHGDLVTVLVDWRFLALLLTGLVGLLLNQNAFQSGRLAAPLTALTLTDPVASVWIGVTVFGETLALTGPRLVGLGLAVAAITAGIFLAGRSSEVSRPAPHRVEPS